jgi:hypothetical protein
MALLGRAQGKGTMNETSAVMGFGDTRGHLKITAGRGVAVRAVLEIRP